MFQSPALPLGRDFNGIVHVHGSVNEPKDMVLTDADFGRAYLTEGWARRFLLDLFRTYPVLFVGYGHNDTVMNYLARALPAEQTQPRFAFALEAEINSWNSLGVVPLVFPQLDAQDYSSLYQGVVGLAKHATRGILDWQTTITEIARTPPSLNQEDMDLIGDVFHHPTRTRFFAEAALHPAWIRWLHENGHLDGLFGASPFINDGGDNRDLRKVARTYIRKRPIRRTFPDHWQAWHRNQPWLLRDPCITFRIT